MAYNCYFTLTITKQVDTPDNVVTIDNVIAQLNEGTISKKDAAELLSAIKENVIPVNEETLIAELHRGSIGARHALDEDGSPYEMCSWYSRQDDLKCLSKKYPTWLFSLKCEGEEPGQIWMEYYFSGKSQTAKAIITFEAFNPAFLK